MNARRSSHLFMQVKVIWTFMAIVFGQPFDS